MSLGKWITAVVLAAGSAGVASADVGFSLGIGGRNSSFGFSYNQPRWGDHHHHHRGHYHGRPHHGHHHHGRGGSSLSIGVYSAPRYPAPRYVYPPTVIVPAPAAVVVPGYYYGY